MFIRKLADVDAFVAVDLGDVPGHGVVRCAPKVLQGGAKDLARTTTYALAVLGRRETGISAGINAAPDDRDAAVAAFAAEVAGWDAGYRLVAAKGVEPDTLGSVEAASGGTSSNAALLATGAVAAFFGNPDDFSFDITGLSMNVPLGSLAEADMTFGLWASPPVSPGVKVSHKKMKFLVATTLIESDIATGYVDFGNTYVNTHGDVTGTAGKAVTISLRQYHEGLQSFPCGMKTIIVES